MGKYKCRVCLAWKNTPDIVLFEMKDRLKNEKQIMHKHLLTHANDDTPKLSFDPQNLDFVGRRNGSISGTEYPRDWFEYETTNSENFRCRHCGKNNGGEFAVGICEPCSDELVYS